MMISQMILAMMIWMMETTNSSYQTVLILLAAGSSTRMGTGTKKEYLPLSNGTVLSTSAKAFLKATSISLICITYPEGLYQSTKEALFADPEIIDLIADIPVIYTTGGSTRQNSVLKALQACNSSNYINSDNSIVLIHDAARPFVTSKIITDTVDATIRFGAAVPVIPPVDTQKELNSDGSIKKHLTRSSLGAVQTPQGFLFQPLLKCHIQAEKQNKEYTDDTEIWDSFNNFTNGKQVHTVIGDKVNKKITFRSDIEDFDKQMIYHTGFGTDLHRLVEGRNLILGGVVLDFDKGEEGHSDGDVLLHAITDAILGASGLGDIGSYFPPEDDKWKNADSAELLKKCWSDVKQSGWSLCNLDAVIEIEKPKFLPYRQKVIDSIANILEVDSSQIFVKAKTNEKLGYIGQGLAVKAYCSCLLYK